MQTICSVLAPNQTGPDLPGRGEDKSRQGDTRRVGSTVDTSTPRQQAACPPGVRHPRRQRARRCGAAARHPLARRLSPAARQRRRQVGSRARPPCSMSSPAAPAGHGRTRRPRRRHPRTRPGATRSSSRRGTGQAPSAPGRTPPSSVIEAIRSCDFRPRLGLPCTAGITA